jgi:hypothetical protein
MNVLLKIGTNISENGFESFLILENEFKAQVLIRLDGCLKTSKLELWIKQFNLKELIDFRNSLTTLIESYCETDINQ